MAPPSAQWFWEELFDRSEITRRIGRIARAASRASPVTLAWLTQKIAGSAAKERRDRYEMVRFAQALFPNIEGERGVDALVALGGYRRYRAILLSLDRMEITSPHAFARIVEAARRLDDDLSGRDEKHAVIAFQVVAAS